MLLYDNYFYVISIYFKERNIYCIMFCLFSNRYLLRMFLLLRMIRSRSKLLAIESIASILY